MKRYFVLLLIVGAIAILVASYLGGLHPLGDSFAAFRLHILAGLAGLALLSVFLRAWLGVLLAGGAFLIGAITLAPYLSSGEPGADTLRLRQHNVWLHNTQLPMISTALEQGDFDVMAFQEVNYVRRRDMLMMNAPSYQYHAYCGPADSFTALMIISRHPMTAEGCDTDFQWVELTTPQGNLTVVNIHLRWPYPYSQSQQVDGILEALRALPRPIVVMGDFNNAAWSHAVQQVAKATDTAPINGIRLTHPLPFWPGVPIDQILVPVPSKARATMVGQYGADHHAVVGELSWPLN